MKKTNSKKTTSMRVAAAMLALTLITSCFASGTFAKYTTSGSAEASARVAKFGVEIEAGNSAFLDKYETDDKTGEYTAQYSVASADGAKVVAPGTSGEIDLFSISGNPEVAVRVNAEMSNIKSIYLKEKATVKFIVNVEEWAEEHHSIKQVDGEWVDTIDPIPEDQEELERLYNEIENDSWTDVNPIKKTQSSEVYYPIKWTLEKDGAAVVTDGTLDDVKAYIDAISGVYEPNELNENIDGTYKLKWEWAFADGNDEQDTALGNFAAGITDSNYVEHSLDESFDFSVTVTQID